MVSFRLGIAFFSSAALLGLGVPSAGAHIALTDPLVRYPAPDPVNNPQKTEPCGMNAGPRTDRVCVYRPGSTITVTWDETINHVGHYRVSFDDAGDDGFVNPVDDNPLPLELARLDDEGGAAFSQEITFPNIECDNCTLQLIQVMSETPPYVEADMYYQCADIVLSATEPEGCFEDYSGDGDNTGTPDAGTGGGGPAGSDAGIGVEDGEDTVSGAQGACSAGGAAGGMAGLLFVLGAMITFTLSRRRR